MNNEYIEEPDPEDENSPEYKEEMFKTYKEMDWTPEDLTDPVDQEEYRTWLKEHNSVEDVG